MFFKTVPENIPQIVKAVNHFGECWFHGDGNIYHNEKDSSDRVTYSNPKDEEAKYRVHFKRGDTIPSNMDLMEKMLLDSRQKEMAASRIPVSVSHVTTIPA